MLVECDDVFPYSSMFITGVNVILELLELQTIMSKMSLEVCCLTVLPEFGVRWRDVARAVRNARLPMTPPSIARIVCRGVAKNLPPEEVDDIISRLRLKRECVAFI